MSASNSVRFSRDGDQFHYLWAARQCLVLLSPQSDLKAISIEGSATPDTEAASPNTGEEVIDVAEYHGGENLKDATLIRYVQLKHSTQNSTEPWPASGLKKTLAGFAKKFIALKQHRVLHGAHTNAEFRFITNRPVTQDITVSVDKVADGSLSTNSAEYRKLKSFIGLNEDDLASFCGLLKIEAEEPGFLTQRILLGQETSKYLPGHDVDAPMALKELVTRKATSEGATNSSITRTDVLRAFGISEMDLFPAPCLLNPNESFIPRVQEKDIAEQVASAQSPVLIHATAGVGKSVLATRLGACFPAGSVTVLYDCFGNGSYRRASSPRHRYKDALVQMANELSSQGLCDPLIPGLGTDNKQYLRAYLHRLQQSVASVQDRNPQALVCIIVDAADNAEMASEEMGDGHSFIRDLLKEPVIQGARLVALCRPERRHLLDISSQVIQLPLSPFNIEESRLFLRHFFQRHPKPMLANFIV